MSKKPSHIHKYKKIKWGKKGTIIFKCMLPGCPHYTHPELVRNRKSICWECARPFVMNPDKMRRVKPKCDGCQQKKDPVLMKLDDLLENL